MQASNFEVRMQDNPCEAKFLKGFYVIFAWVKEFSFNKVSRLVHYIKKSPFPTGRDLIFKNFPFTFSAGVESFILFQISLEEESALKDQRWQREMNLKTQRWKF